MKIQIVGRTWTKGSSAVEDHSAQGQGQRGWDCFTSQDGMIFLRLINGLGRKPQLLRRLRREDCKFKARLHNLVIPYLKIKISR